MQVPEPEANAAASVASQNLAAVGIPMSFFLSQWPFFLLMDADMAIISAGPSLVERVPQALAGASFHDVFTVLRPEAARLASFATLKEHAKVSFRVASRSLIAGGKQLLLRGAMHCLGEGCNGRCLFLCSALVLNLDDMVNAQMQMNDFPLHDAARDLLFMSESNAAQKSLLVRLERLSAELAHEQARSDELLFSMLPRTVVADLREGRRFRGQEWPAVTILFSDIVGFTDLSAQCQPLQVCRMLDELYTVFDALSAHFDVYKVETIGDAYMIAGGITGDPSSHASAVADMAVAMIAACGLVVAPHTGRHIDIRIGMHSGPAMAGVVGTKMPRYTFFGDTINTASRMESNGIQGKIHCSEASKEALASQSSAYSLVERGSIQVKGKGAMDTFWLTEIPPQSAKVVKRAVEAAETALGQLIRDRADAETGSEADDAACLPRKDKVPLWDRSRRRWRGMFLGEEDMKRTHELRAALESGLKKSGSSVAEVSLEQDATGAFTGASFLRRQRPASHSAPRRASTSSSEEEEQSPSPSGGAQHSLPGAGMVHPKSMSVEDMRSMFKRDIRLQQRGSRGKGVEVPARDAGGSGHGQQARESSSRSSRSFKPKAKRCALERPQDGARNGGPTGGEVADAGSGDDDDAASGRTAEWVGEAADKVLAGLHAPPGTQEGQGVPDHGAPRERLVERRTIPLKDPSGLAAYTMAGLHSDLALPLSAAKCSQAAVSVSAEMADAVEPSKQPGGRQEGSWRTQQPGGASQVSPRARPARANQPQGAELDPNASSRVASMVSAFCAAEAEAPGASDEGAGALPARPRCPFGFDLLAAAADDLLQVRDSL